MTAQVCEVENHVVYCLVRPHVDGPLTEERLLEDAADLRQLQSATSLWPRCESLTRVVFRAIDTSKYSMMRPGDVTTASNVKALFKAERKDKQDGHLLPLLETERTDDRVPLQVTLAQLNLGEAVVLYSMHKFQQRGALLDVFVLLGIVPWFAAPAVSEAVRLTSAGKSIDWCYVTVNSAAKGAFDPVQTMLRRATPCFPLPPVPCAIDEEDDDDDHDQSQFSLFGQSLAEKRLQKTRLLSNRLRTLNARPATQNDTAAAAVDSETTNKRARRTAPTTNTETEEIIITLHERVDMRLIDYLVQTPEAIPSITERTKFRRYAESARRHGGRVPIRYVHRSFAPHFGRLAALDESGKQSSSMQGMKRELSSTLANSYYWQLDVANAHPTILLSEAKARGWPTKALERYVFDRERLLKETIPNDRDLAKRYYLAAMFGSGGGPTKHVQLPKFAHDYKKEMQCVVELFYAANESMHEPHQRHLLANNKHYDPRRQRYSLLSNFLQNRECEILRAGIEFMRERGWCIGALKHDGFLVEKRTDVPPPTAEQLGELSKLIAQRCKINDIRFTLETFDRKQMLNIPEHLRLPPIAQVEATTTTATTTIKIDDNQLKS